MQDIELQNVIMQWSSNPYGELSAAVVLLRYVAMVHQTNHWIAAGDSFYGDHLLFERLYNAVIEEVDQVAEKAVGLGSSTNVDITLQARQLLQLVEQHSSYAVSIPRPNELATSSLAAEATFAKGMNFIYASLQNSRRLTKGVDNLLAGIIDTHESHVYLLKQRAGR